MDEIPMTRVGYDKLKADLDHLESVVMPEIAQRVASARAEGDLKENAEYHGARETQAHTQRKVDELRTKLSYARIIDTTRGPKDQVSFGATVIVKNLDMGDEETFTLVGAGEEDYDTGKIMVTSLLAQGLIGHKVGDKVEIDVPGGKERFQIKKIKFDE